ncbi:MAG: hypothetical protein IJD68_02035 [Ruminococcus sp.]|nr:hypothetical protein [Ruminococcus sp.]
MMFDNFDGFFDFDNNGELDALEESAEFSFIMGMMEDNEHLSEDEDDF